MEGMEYQPVTREGTFKANALAWSVYEAKSGAVAINVDFVPSAEWSGQEWVSWADYAPHKVSGAFYVIDKTGQLNETAVKQMAQLKWDGTFKSIEDLPPSHEVQIVVKCETYNNVDRFKVAFINPADGVPGAPPNAVGAEDLKKLDNRFGSLLRAAAAVAGK